MERGVFFPFVSSLGLQADGDGRCGVYEPFPFGGTDGYLPLRVVTVVSSSPARYMARRREAWQLSGREKHGGAMFGGSVDFGIIGRYGRPVTGMAVDMYVL